MSEFQRCAGINITSSKLQFVEIEKINNQLQICNVGQTFISPIIDFYNKDEEFLRQQLQASFDELKIRNAINSNIVSFTLPPELFITLQLPYDENLSQAEVREEFNWEISELFPYVNIDELAIKFYELDSSILPSNRNALVVALNKKYLALVKNFCLKNSLTPKLVDNASITANNFLNNIKRETTIHLFNTNKSVSLFINKSSKPAYVEVFKKKNANYVDKIISTFLNDKLKTILDESFNSAILSGEDLEGDLVSEIGRSTELVFEKINPFNIINLKPEFEIQNISVHQISSFISATAVASRFWQV